MAGLCSRINGREHHLAIAELSRLMKLTARESVRTVLAAMLAQYQAAEVKDTSPPGEEGVQINTDHLCRLAVEWHRHTLRTSRRDAAPRTGVEGARANGRRNGKPKRESTQIRGEL